MARRRRIKFVYRRIADEIRDDITTGKYAPGQRLPSEEHLRQRYGVARKTISDAYDVVEHEGLVVRGNKPGRFVRQASEHTMIELRGGDQVGARLPRQAELDDLDVDEITALLVVTHRDGTVDRYPGDCHTLFVEAADSPTADPPTA